MLIKNLRSGVLLIMSLFLFSGCWDWVHKNEKKPKREVVDSSVTTESQDVLPSPRLPNPKVFIEKVKNDNNQEIINQNPGSLETETEIPIPIKIHNQIVGTEVVKISISDTPKVIAMYSNSIRSLFKPALTKEIFDQLSSCLGIKPRLSTDELLGCKIVAKYDLEDSTVVLEVPDTWVQNYDISFRKDKPQAPSINLENAGIAGVINLTGSSSTSQGGLLGGQNNSVGRADVSLNHGSLTLQTGAVLLNGSTNRTETNLVIPDKDGTNQVWLGDMSFSPSNNIQIPSLSGVGYFKSIKNLRNGTIDTGYLDFVNQTSIEVYRNESLVLASVLPAGRFNFRDIALEQGQNNIRIVARDTVSGKITTKEYSEYISPENKGEHGFEMSAVVGSERTTMTVDNSIQYYGTTSYFYGANYGVTKNFTTGITLEKLNEAGLAQLTETYYLGNYTFRLSGGESISISNNTVIDAAVYRSGILGPINRLSLEYQLNNSILNSALAAPGANTISNFEQTTLKASFVPIHGIAISTGLTEATSTQYGYYQSLFVTAAKSFPLSKRWRLSLGGGQVFSTLSQINQTNYSAMLSWSEASADGTQENVAISSTNQLNSADARWSKEGTSVDGQVVQDTGATNSVGSVSASKDFNYGALSASVASSSDGSSSESVSGSTAIAFTNKAIGISRTIPNSFIIYKNDDDKKFDFGVQNEAGGNTSRNSYLGTAVYQLPNFANNSTITTFPNPEQFSIENTEIVSTRSGFRTGATYLLHNNDEILIIVKIIGSLGEAIDTLEAELVCKRADKVERKPIFTDQEGNTSFSAIRGSACYIESTGAKTDELDLNWPIKYKELEPVVLHGTGKEKTNEK